jgi:hypothetical protein
VSTLGNFSELAIANIVASFSVVGNVFSGANDFYAESLQA